MNENKLKHLELIQIVITRMNTNSFMIKGWMAALVAALFALSAKDADQRFLYVTFFPILFFWALDAFYLSQERQFRALYEDVCKKTDADIDFSMKKTKHNIGKNTWFRSTFSEPLLLTYPPVLVLVFIINAYMRYSLKSHGC